MSQEIPVIQLPDDVTAFEQSVDVFSVSYEAATRAALLTLQTILCDHGEDGEGKTAKLFPKLHEINHQYKNEYPMITDEDLSVINAAFGQFNQFIADPESFTGEFAESTREEAREWCNFAHSFLVREGTSVDVTTKWMKLAGEGYLKHSSKESYWRTLSSNRSDRVRQLKTMMKDLGSDHLDTDSSGDGEFDATGRGGDQGGESVTPADQ